MATSFAGHDSLLLRTSVFCQNPLRRSVLSATATDVFTRRFWLRWPHHAFPSRHANRNRLSSVPAEVPPTSEVSGCAKTASVRHAHAPNQTDLPRPKNGHPGAAILTPRRLLMFGGRCDLRAQRVGRNVLNTERSSLVPKLCKMHDSAGDCYTGRG